MPKRNLRPEEAARFGESRERALRMSQKLAEIIAGDHLDNGDIDLSAAHCALTLVSGYLMKTIMDGMPDETDRDEMLAAFLHGIRLDAQRGDDEPGVVNMPMFVKPQEL